MMEIVTSALEVATLVACVFRWSRSM